MKRAHFAFCCGLCLVAAAGARAQSPGTSAPGDDKVEEAAAPASSGLELAKFLKGVKADGKVALTEAVQKDMLALVPANRRGEACGEPVKAIGDAHALKDRGDGAVLFAHISSCKGNFIFAWSTGAPPRVARLFNLEEGQAIHNVAALNLSGGKREADVALTLFTPPHTHALRLFVRRPDGFVYSDAGTLPDYELEGDCAGHEGEAEGAGYASFVKTDAKSRLQVLRIEDSCSGGPWQASCLLWSLEKGALGKAGVCALPDKLAAKALRSQGWR